MELDEKTYVAETCHAKVYEHCTILTSAHCDGLTPRQVAARRKTPTRSERDISCFSTASRRRLIRVMARLRTGLLGPAIHVTLTYHLRWSDDTYGDLHAWLEWLRRRTDGRARYLWRLEWQRRGAPHYHVMLWMPRDLEIGSERDWRTACSLAWATIIGTRDDRAAMQHGVKVQVMSSYRHALHYISKYVAKVSQDERTGLGRRRWGRSANLPVNPYYRAWLDRTDDIALRRIARRLARARGVARRTARRLAQGRTICIYASADTITTLLDWLTPPWCTMEYDYPPECETPLDLPAEPGEL